tara:strand:+ start:511 stop:1110 length:600 start_codon:yes stop_codon:yes gene_type:complete
MSIIYNYPKSTPYANDLLVGTAVYDEIARKADPMEGNPTRNFSVDSIGEFVGSKYKLQDLPINKTFLMTNAMIKAGAFIQTTMVAADWQPAGDKVILPLEFSAVVINGSDATGISGNPPIQARVGEKTIGSIPNDAFSGVPNTKTFYTRGIPQIGSVIPANNPWTIRPTADFSSAGFNGSILVVLSYQLFDLNTYTFAP